MQKIVNGVSYKFGNRSLGLLLIRVALGIVFFAHGWNKVHNIPGVEGMFAHMGLASPPRADDAEATAPAGSRRPRRPQ